MAHVEETQSRGSIVFLWLLKLGVAGIFLMAGYSKLSGVPQMVQMFNVIGIGQWFRYLTGSIEILSAVLILIPRVAGFGALFASGTMTGAIATHLFIIGGNPAMPIGLLAASLIVLYANRHQLLSLLGSSFSEDHRTSNVA